MPAHMLKLIDTRLASTIALVVPMNQMMDLVVQDFPFSSIASDLNEKGFRTREGKLWSQVSVFQMIPRLIEIGPGLFSTAEWAARRDRLRRMG